MVRQRTVEQTGVDIPGREVHYLVNLTPVPTDAEEPKFVAAITTDLTAAKQLQSEYQALFEKVPCFVALINRDHRVVKGNELFRADLWRTHRRRVLSALQATWQGVS